MEGPTCHGMARLVQRHGLLLLGNAHDPHIQWIDCEIFMDIFAYSTPLLCISSRIHVPPWVLLSHHYNIEL